ncbi:MAG: hypothetical protein F6K19_01630 [Cyanothece sp. SIO1E1]|nr:hypothetical protein [Cyanothece sp. SIO1E1]
MEKDEQDWIGYHCESTMGLQMAGLNASLKMSYYDGTEFDGNVSYNQYTSFKRKVHNKVKRSKSGGRYGIRR